MRHLFTIILLAAAAAFGQDLNSPSSQTASGSITAASTSCLSTSCVWILTPPASIPFFGSFAGAGIVTVRLTGTFVATVKLERSIDGSSWTPYFSGTTTGSYSVILNNGTRLVRVRASAYTSGKINVSMNYGWSTDDSGVLVWPGGFSSGAAPIGGGATFATPATVQSFSATPTFDLSANNTYETTLTNNVTAVTFTNPTAGQVVLIKWIQDNSGSHTVAYGASASKTCDVVSQASSSTIQLLRVAANGTTIEGFGCPSDAAGLVTAGAAAAAFPTPASGIVCWLDSTANTLQCKNSSGVLFSTVRTAGSATANQWVDYIAATGIPHTSRPACADLSDSGAGCSGSAGMADSGTNGIVKRTALNTTGPAAAADIFSLFTGCSGTQYPGFDGACHSASGGSFDPHDSSTFWDIETFPPKGHSQGYIGKWGWVLIGSCSVEGPFDAVVANLPGLYKIAAPGSGECGIVLDNSGNINWYPNLSAAVWQFQWTLLVNSDASTNVTIRGGVAGGANAATPSDGVAIEHTDADGANWQYELWVGASKVGTVDSGVAYSNAGHIYTVKFRGDGTKWYAAIKTDGGSYSAEKTICSGACDINHALPTATSTPFFTITSLNGSVKATYLNRASVSITSLAR